MDGKEGGREERKGGMVEGWMGERKRRKEEGSEEEGGREEKRQEERGEGELREQGGKEGHSDTGSESADPLARPSSKSENSPQATLIWSCSFCLKDNGHCPLHPAMLELQPGGQGKQDALTAHEASISRHTTAPRFLQPLN